MKRIGLYFLCLVSVVAFLSGQSIAEPRARLEISSPYKQSVPLVATYAAVSLPKGGMLHISSQQDFQPMTNLVSTTIQQTHHDLEGIFGPLPPISVEVKLMSPDVFSLATGAPRWTNALYYDDTIIIPVQKSVENEDDFRRSVRHEFTHAVIHELSGGKCPGWLDEGMAQFMEGSTNPLIRLALQQWLDKNPPVPFHLLQKGFTKLEKKYVAAAYAQSLWAAKILTKEKGFLAVRNFFEALKNDARDPFISTLKTSESAFEEQLACSLKNKACLEVNELCHCSKVSE